MPHKTIITMLLALLTTIPTFAQDINSELKKVGFYEVSFEIRGTGWQREETASGIILTRSEEQGRAQNLAV